MMVIPDYGLRVSESEALILDEQGLFQPVATLCPQCNTAVVGRVSIADAREPLGEQLDLCPVGEGVALPEEQLLVCLHCFLVGQVDVFTSTLSPQDLEALKQLEFPSDIPLPWERFRIAAQVVKALGYGSFATALMLLQGAWSARRHEQAEAEAELLALAGDAFTEMAQRAEKNKNDVDQADPVQVTLAYLLAGECDRRLGAQVSAQQRLQQARAALTGVEADVVEELSARIAAIESAVLDGDIAPRTLLLESVADQGIVVPPATNS